MVVTCKIEFEENVYGSFYVGQLVTGTVTLKSNRPKEVKAVTLRVTGEARTSWTEKVFDKEHSYSGHESYIQELVYLLGSEDSTKCTIPPGVHDYSFDFQIPYNCPTSIESSDGYIRYVVQVTLVRPWKINQTFTKGFTVLNMLDLNSESPLLRQPASIEIEKTYGCGSCRSEPMAIEVKLAKSGFVPGEQIPINITVTNDSHVPVQELKIFLIMEVVCFTDPPFSNNTHCRTIVTKLKGDGVLRHCKKVFDYALEVPATPPTCTQLCRIIKINYEVNVEAQVKGFHSSQVLAVPITIGNIPFMDIIDQQPKSQNDSNKDVATTSQKCDDEKMQQQEKFHRDWIHKLEKLPPNYEEANHIPRASINATEPYDFGEKEFSPRYPVFRGPNTNTTKRP